ncbi:hypothetical protein [Bacillus wiedmannii]|uniref:hypothetical protein n=1 Tax=Bacillus wiedmannii TaxID=1890302 RepID=UPI000BF0CC97|nr:hypothetical protein [Bacillus wiedmannii]PEM08555.1 hypothetical protein CN610_20090 [Bacillus wiedmannii]
MFGISSLKRQLAHANEWKERWKQQVIDLTRELLEVRDENQKLKREKQQLREDNASLYSDVEFLRKKAGEVHIMRSYMEYDKKKREEAEKEAEQAKQQLEICRKAKAHYENVAAKALAGEEKYKKIAAEAVQRHAMAETAQARLNYQKDLQIKTQDQAIKHWYAEQEKAKKQLTAAVEVGNERGAVIARLIDEKNQLKNVLADSKQDISKVLAMLDTARRASFSGLVVSTLRDAEYKLREIRRCC